jgi:hypothetical protein
VDMGGILIFLDFEHFEPAVNKMNLKSGTTTDPFLKRWYSWFMII